MIGLLIQLLLSWLLLWISFRKNLSVLGFRITNSRIIDLLFGFGASAMISSIIQLTSTFVSGNWWIRNEEFTPVAFANSLWWTVKSVLFEELIFRGALLYILIRFIGATRACIISAISFGIYHWFSSNAFGDVVQMIILFFMTAIFGLMFAFAYAKTGSLYLPFGLHLGWNLFSIVVFSNGPLGEQLFVKENVNQPEGYVSLLIFLLQLFALPLLIFWYLRKIPKHA